MALCCSEAGFRALGYDTDAVKTEAISEGRSYIKYLDVERVGHARRAGLTAITRIVDVAASDAIIICVQTPLDQHREPDLRFVERTIAALTPYISGEQVISLESTTYPRMTEELIVPHVQKAGFTLGEDVFVVYSPEREHPGNVQFNATDIPKVVGGITASCRRVGEALYGSIVKTRSS